MTAPPPPAEGLRLQWGDVPEPVRAAIERRLGSPVAQAVSQPGGFSPGVAARLRTASGERIFLKAVGPEPNPSSRASHLREARIAAALPPGAPVPPFLWALRRQGWVALAFQEIDGRQPAQPWRADELGRVLEAINALSACLTPSPIPSRLAGRARRWGPVQRREWRQLRDDRDGVRQDLDPWSRRHLEALVRLERAAPAAVDGETLLHLDLRADNLLLTADRVLVVDWPHARLGAPWLDAVFFAPSVTMQGGPPPEDILARVPAATGAAPEAITAAVAVVAGFFTRQALLPPPPGLPTLRAFQRAQGEVARAWLARRTGLTGAPP